MRKHKAQKPQDPIATELDQITNKASEFYSGINRDMAKAMAILKKGAFKEAIHLAGNAASNAAQLHRALLQVEDLMVRMKKREEFRAQQIRLIENPELSEKVV